GNISGASGVNYAIYTNSGSVRFGDVVTAVNTVNCPELAIDADGRNIGAAMAPFRISGTFRRGVNDSTYGAHMTPTISGNMDGEYAGGLYINTNVNVLNPGSLFGIYDYVNANSLLFNDVTGLFLGFTGLTNTTNVYGIQVGHLIAPASVNKYAIHTGTGSVRFGDVVNMTSNMVLAGSVIGTFKATDLSYFARTILPYQDIDFARFDNTQSWLIHTTGATKRPSLGMIYLDGYCNVGSEWYGISTVGRWDNQGTMSGGTGQFYQNKSLFQYGASVATTATLTGHYIYQQFQTAASGTFTNVYGFRLEQ
ncbi:MAG: hypothetical protein GTN80_08160, partial [Nitrososphaeria archaeon]|nr:hypothetical protein [Nitrososphaeria archaeon]NIQ33596.1 hypothetical protein [Nitrososphaeria archaeon]